MNTGIGFFKNGAGSVLDSTITAAKSIVSGVTTFLSHLYLLSISFCKKRSWKSRLKKYYLLLYEKDVQRQ